MGNIHPAMILLAGSILLALLPVKSRRVVSLLLPIFSFVNLLAIPEGTMWHVSWAGFDLTVLRVDRLSLLFGYLFHLAALIATIYSLHLDDKLQITTGLMYAGAAIGAVFAGDLLILFIFWELLAVTSVFQVWARGGQRALDSGTRYLLLHIASGLLLLAGTALHYLNTGSLAFDHIGLGSTYAWLILLAIGIKCAFPLFHTWLVDAYPEATPTGTVFLSAFTTKAAIYALARGFAGEEVLIVIGGVMTMFPIFFAVIENDLRRVLGYSMINQIGFMVVGIGLGPGMGVNGAVAHAFNDVIFKGLLFMSMGAVLYRTGRMNGSELGGLYKSMPWTCLCCIIGASSISAFPLFSGFISKSMVMQAASNGGYVVVWLALLFASAGVFHHAGIKIPFFAFYAHDSGIRCKEAPLNMRIAMTISAVLCVFIGSNPSFLYGLLPYPVEYEPYTTTHVVLQLQVLFYSALAFTVLKLTNIYPPELASTNLDVDWFSRRMFPGVVRSIVRVGGPIKDGFFNGGKAVVRSFIGFVKSRHDGQGLWGRTWLTENSVLVVVMFLAVYLLFFY
ncbi:MAG: Na(+)/H(+) antiporter subunit D [Candidatus Latescibacteria bacterium]|jgi:multicomponent Na+:H+ antiporter subunit D|nr:Na(+)/H(+) antiporter subunit D [Candidatus Latescibacterota bacterium]